MHTPEDYTWQICVGGGMSMTIYTHGRCLSQLIIPRRVPPNPLWGEIRQNGQSEACWVNMSWHEHADVDILPFLCGPKLNREKRERNSNNNPATNNSEADYLST